MFHEREMYDMMGIVFEGNRDLRRIYMSPDYRCFPQRKDFLLPDDAADSSAAGVQPARAPRDVGPDALHRDAAGSTATYPATEEGTVEVRSGRWPATRPARRRPSDRRPR